MSAITIDKDLVHYEVLGRGRPVILVHSWLGSWRYWIPAMQQLNMKYRVYALDLWGFGDSGKDSRRYDFQSQVTLLEEFMEKMGITKAALVGHGLGAAVVARYAARYPDRVPRLMVVCPPLFRMAPPVVPLTANPLNDKPLPAPSSAPAPAPPSAPATTPAPSSAPAESPHSEAETMPVRTDEIRARIQAAVEAHAKAAEEQTIRLPVPPDPTPKSPREAAKLPNDRPWRDPSLPQPLSEVPTMPKVDYVPDARDIQVQRANPLKEHLSSLVDPVALLEKHMDAGSDLEKLKVEVSKADRMVIALNVESFAGVDTLRDLKSLPVPTATIYGANDTLVPVPDDEMLASLKEAAGPSVAVKMDGVRHFPMLENAAQFTRLLLDFLEIPDVASLKIKETWERRVR